MAPELIGYIVALVGVVISACVSYFTARNVSKKPEHNEFLLRKMQALESAKQSILSTAQAPVQLSTPNIQENLQSMFYTLKQKINASKTAISTVEHYLNKEEVMDLKGGLDELNTMTLNSSLGQATLNHTDYLKTGASLTSQIEQIIGDELDKTVKQYEKNFS